MKKLLLICILLSILLLCSCKDENAVLPKADETQVNLISEAVSEEETTVDLSSDEADIDLTKLNQTMLYSQLYNMTNMPDEYFGKTVKLKGKFKLLYNSDHTKILYGCEIQDATACCTNGIEFVPKDTYSYPDDFPKDGEEITVVGKFEMYIENSVRYLNLVETDISF